MWDDWNSQVRTFVQQVRMELKDIRDELHRLAQAMHDPVCEPLEVDANQQVAELAWDDRAPPEYTASDGSSPYDKTHDRLQSLRQALSQRIETLDRRAEPDPSDRSDSQR